jgi:beta-lactamase class A
MENMVNIINIENKIKEIIDKYTGTVGIVLRDSNGNSININENIVFPSASIIKLFILGALDKDDYNKPITLIKDDKVSGCGVLKVMNDGIVLKIRDIAYLMITLSDNTATNMLISYIGMDKINEYINKNRYKGTILGRKMMDTKAREAGRDNFTTPRDVYGILQLLFEDNTATDMLKNQASINKLPLYIVNEVEIAHKTGELLYIEHDVGRMYFKNEYVDIIVLTKDLSKNEDGIRINSEIGKLIFDSYSK